MILNRKFCCLFGALLAVVLFVDSTQAQLFKFRKKKDPIPVVFNRMPTKAEVLQVIAANNSKFKQLSSDIVVSLDGTPKLRGTMQLELPRRLRIKAGVMGVSQFGVDVGSNDQDFWVWTKVNLPNQKPAIFHASHEGFGNASSAVRQAIPLEPVWLLEGLGLIQFEATDFHELDPNLTAEGHIRLVTTRQTSNGQIYRTTLLHAQQGIILQQALYNSRGERIAYTNSEEYKSYPKQGIVLPQKIVMHLSSNGQESKMVIETSDYSFDSLYGDPRQMWALPQPDGVPSIDLTRLGQ